MIGGKVKQNSQYRIAPSLQLFLFLFQPQLKLLFISFFFIAMKLVGERRYASKLHAKCPWLVCCYRSFSLVWVILEFPCILIQPNISFFFFYFHSILNVLFLYKPSMVSNLTCATFNEEYILEKLRNIKISKGKGSSKIFIWNA